VEYSHLDTNARGLVQFHRDGYGVDDEGYINDYFIDQVLKGQESISRVVMHFAMCLQRQQLLQDNFLDGANVLKKQTALPMFHMGERKSIYICKDGMRWLLKQIKTEIAADDGEWEDVDDNAALDDVGEVDVIEDIFREQVMNFRGNELMDIFTYKQWLIRLFDIGKNGNFKGFPNPATSGKRYDHWGGVKVVTDGVTASVFYVKNNQLESLMIIDDEDEDVKMESMDYVGGNKRSSSSKKLTLPLPPRSELIMIILPFFLY
jgi:hypothetical protein